MIEKGDMVYWKGTKFQVGVSRAGGNILGLLIPNSRNKMVFSGEVKPIYRNGVKVRVRVGLV